MLHSLPMDWKQFAYDSGFWFSHMDTLKPSLRTTAHGAPKAAASQHASPLYYSFRGQCINYKCPLSHLLSTFYVLCTVLGSRVIMMDQTQFYPQGASNLAPD